MEHMIHTLTNGAAQRINCLGVNLDRGGGENLAVLVVLKREENREQKNYLILLISHEMVYARHV